MKAITHHSIQRLLDFKLPPSAVRLIVELPHVVPLVAGEEALVYEIGARLVQTETEMTNL